jgi:hypothetical protein
MAQIENPDLKIFKVVLTEYERGWGSKIWDTLYFDNELEAKTFATDYNQQNNSDSYVPDWYVSATYEGKVR